MFTYLKDQKADFYFLQETCSDANDESMWQSELGRGGGGGGGFFFSLETLATVYLFLFSKPSNCKRCFC